ncbi:MAG: endonuclease, partial [Bacteroidota bacterium]
MRLAALAALFVAAPVLAQPQTILYPGQTGQALLDVIELDYAPTLTLGYGPARDSLYAHEQQVNGELCGVYTRFCIQLNPNADPSTDAYQKGVNAEHTWPQSQGAADEPSKSDLHHLFPAKANVNSSRSNHPYGEIPDAEADGWYRQASSQSTIPTVFVTEWSEKDNDHPDPAWGGRFEPREDHKGNAARAVFYFRAIYPGQVSAYTSQDFFDIQKDDLIVWHYADPVDLAEYARSTWIASLQGAHNPFILDSTLARRAYNLNGSPEPPTASDTLWVNEIHYDNTGSDQNEGVELAGLEGTDLSGWTLSFVNGNGGGVYKTVSLSGT